MTEKMNCCEAILEAFVDFEKEISVIVSRGFDGTKSTFPIGENSHSNHILKETIVPAQIQNMTQQERNDHNLANLTGS
jgi:5-(carboxyamino)imidazole ribonucleotide synthase